MEAPSLHPPRGLSRILWRLPIPLYRAGLGWLLGSHFLMLTHTGRKSGKPRYVVLEALRHDKAMDTYYVAAGFGEQADWFRNVQKTPQVVIQTGRRRLEVEARRLPPEEAEREVLEYARHHPNVLRGLLRLVGYASDGSEESFRALSRVVPIIALAPCQ